MDISNNNDSILAIKTFHFHNFFIQVYQLLQMQRKWLLLLSVLLFQGRCSMNLTCGGALINVFSCVSGT